MESNNNGGTSRNAILSTKNLKNIQAMIEKITDENVNCDKEEAT